MAQGRSTKIISTIQWIRTSRLSIKNSLYGQAFPCGVRNNRLVVTGGGRGWHALVLRYVLCRQAGVRSVPNRCRRFSGTRAPHPTLDTCSRVTAFYLTVLGRDMICVRSGQSHVLCRQAGVRSVPDRR